MTRRVSLVLLLVGMAALWGLWPRGGPPAERTAVGELGPDAAGPGEGVGPSTQAELRLELGDPEGLALRYLSTPGLDAVAIWPDWPLPDLETTERLQELGEELSGRNRPETQAVVHEVLLGAATEGLGFGGEAALTDPGRAFVELEAARWRVGHEYHHEVRAWMRSLVGPDETIEGRFGELWRNGPDRPVEDTTVLLELARAVEERFPEHPVADHARLAEVLGSFPLGLREGRDPYDAGPAFDALAAIEDPVLAEQAALHLTRMDRWIEVPSSGLDALAAVRTSHPDAALAISGFAMDRALAAGDAGRAASWRARYEAAVAAACPVQDGELPCAASRETLTDATGRLAARGLATPGSWQDALAAAAWRCVLDGLPQDGVSVGHGRFTDGRWTWSGWDRPTAWTACLERADPGPPVPPEGLVLRLEAVGG